MKTVAEFLESPIYGAFIQHFSPAICVEDEIQASALERWKDRLRQRQYVLEGFSCKLSCEEELAQWYETLFIEEKKDLICWIRGFWQYSQQTEDEYPDGEEPDEPSTLISVGKVVRSCFALYAIEYELLKYHPEALADYYRRVRIPGVAKYAKEMKNLYSRIFAG